MKMMRVPKLRWSGLTIVVCIALFAIVANYEGSITVGSRSPLSKSNKEASLNTAETYPALTCPTIPGATKTTLYLPSSRVGIHQLLGPINATKGFSTPAKSAINLINPVLLSGASSISTTSIVGSGWSAFTPCAVGNGDSWFVGGTGNITSNDQLVIDNSGSSLASISISIYTEHGAISPVNRSIKPNSQVTFGIAGLAPGENSPVVDVSTLSGRVSAFLVDKRSKGLTTLGGSMIPPSAPPASIATIMGLSSKSTNNSFVRIFNFATVPAHVMGTLYSSSGSFTPVGFDSITIPAQKVIEVPIPNVSSTGEFAIQLSSDQPIVAGAFIGSQSSFTWFPSEAPMPAATITLPSIQPVIQLLGSHIQLQVSWISTHTLGQLATRGTHTISGSGFISWTLPQAVTQMTLTPISGGGQSVGAILTANGEKVVVPISIGAGPTPINRSTPIPDARIISRG